MSTFHCKESTLVPNFKHDVIERDEHGVIIGAFTGYYNPRSFTVSLYPNYRHPFVRWAGTPRKRCVSARFVICAPKTKQEIKQAKAMRSQTAAAMRELRDLPGQLRFKF